MSQRTNQIASQIRRVLQKMIQRDLNDPRIRGLVSVTSVSVAPDLADATIFISVTPPDRASLTIQGLTHAGGRIRTELAKSLRLRRVPRLRFEHDETIARQAELYAAIREGLEEDQQSTDQLSQTQSLSDSEE